MHGEQPDADELAALTQRPVLRKAPAVDPVLGLVGLPASTPVRAASPEVQDRAERAYAAAGVELPRPAPAPPAVKLRKQGGYYAHEADVDRAKAAWKRTQLLPGGYPTWSAFQLAAVMRLTEELEREHNGGEPFPPLPPDTPTR